MGTDHVVVSCDIPEGLRERLHVLGDAWAQKHWMLKDKPRLEIVFATEDKGHRKSWLVAAMSDGKCSAWCVRYAKVYEMASTTEKAMSLWMAWAGAGKGPGLEYWDADRG